MKVKQNHPINDLIKITRKHWDLKRVLTDVKNKPILNGMSLIALASPHCDVEIRTLSKFTGVNAPLIGFFYDHTKALSLFMVGCVSLLLGWFPVSHSSNLHTLPPNSFRTDGGSFFNLQGTTNV